MIGWTASSVCPKTCSTTQGFQIDASEIYQKMRKSLGSKSYELTKEHIRQVTDIYLDFKETEQSKIFENADFGYQKITVNRPLRLGIHL